MLFLAALIVVSGLCGAESQNAKSVRNQSSATIYNNTLKVVQRSGPLHLLWYSRRLQNNLDECLISRFLKNETNGARRTLETNGKVPEQQTKDNITITLIEGPDSPSLKIEAIGGHLSRHWDYPHYLAFARKNCFVLEALITFRRKPYCVVWGAIDSKKKPFDCFQKAEKHCEIGTKVDLTKCADKKERQG
uniref:Putative secreted protein 94 n=1 Tax=Amblyomma cajennense TaxID=34607 RepID=A0A023FDU4_AMBCJ